MKKIYILLLFVFAVVTNVSADLTVTSGQDLTYSGGDYGNIITVQDGGEVTFTGDVTVLNLVVAEGGNMYVDGDLTVGSDTENNIDFVVGGTLIVTGNLSVNGKNSLELNINTSGVLVVGGSYEYIGKNGHEDEANAGQMYLNDPNDFGGTTEEGAVTDDLEALVDSGAIPDDILSDFLGDSSSEIEWDYGATTYLWETPANWTLDNEPNSIFESAVIGAEGGSTNYICNLSGDVVLANLTINTNSTLNIEAGSSITIYGDLTINGTLNVNNTSGFPASIIIKGDVSGIANVNWDGLTSSRWWYMSYSVGSASSITGTTNNYYFDNSSATYPDWVSGFGSGGYDAIAFKVESGATFSYSGVFNNETSYNFVHGGGSGIFYSFGNPYPSYLDFDLMSAGANNFAASYWIIDENGNATTYNAPTGEQTNPTLSRYIAPGQSIWVQTNTTGATLTIDKTACTHGDGGVLKSATIASDRDKIRLNLTNGSVKDEALILFADFGSDIFTDYDSQKKFSGSASGNLSIIKDGKYTVINSLPSVYSEQVVPLSVYFTNFNENNTYTLQVSELSGFDDNVGIYLIDNEVEGSKIDLREVKEYSFKPTSALSNSRFQIKVVPGITTDIVDEDMKDVSSNNIKIFAIQQKAIVKVDDSTLKGSQKLINVYNVAGQLVFQSELNKLVTEVSLPQTNTIYIVNVVVDGKSYQQKVMSQN